MVFYKNSCTRCPDNPYTVNDEIVDHILIKGDDFSVQMANIFLDGKYDISTGMNPLSDHYGVMVALEFESGVSSFSNIWAPLFVLFFLIFFV